jgi:hypothetical protein
MFLRILDRLEEILITGLMLGATALIEAIAQGKDRMRHIGQEIQEIEHHR